MRARLSLHVLLWGLFSVCCPALPAQQPAQEKDFVSIFNGENLEGWEGDPVYWRVENKELVGEIKPETRVQNNTFIIWKGGAVGDFELQLEYRVSAQGNSGLNYRSYELALPKLAMRGYQVDIDGQDRYSGNLYEERGRAFLAFRGQKNVVTPGELPRIAELFGDAAQLQKSAVKKEDWNALHLVVRGDHHRVSLNGTLVSELIDHDHANGPQWGLLGVQVHVGPPMTIAYRNIRLARFPRAGEEEPKVADLLIHREKLMTLQSRQNPPVQQALDGAKAKLLKLDPVAPVDGAQELTIKSLPTFVRHDLGREGASAPQNPEWDVVLMEGERTIRAVGAASFREKLSAEEAYQWKLRWDASASAYRVAGEPVK